MVSGRTYDVTHQEMLLVTVSSVVLSHGVHEGVGERFEMFSPLLIEEIRHIETPAPAPQGNGQGA